MRPYNLHTHTTFCDGDNTPEELAAAALAAGCETLGFSGHSHTGFDERYCMSPAGTREYIRQVRRLQAEYAPRLRILLGIEQDYYSEQPAEGYDFVIGSVHYLHRHGEYLPVDEDPQWQQRIVADHYGGNYYAFAVAKGWRTQPYPANWLLKELQARGARLIFSSDCHKADQLLAGWQEWGSLCGPSL